MSTKYAAAKPNVGISGGSSAQTGHTRTWSMQLLAEQVGEVLTSFTSKMLNSPCSVRFHLMSVSTPDAAGSTSAFQQLGGASTMCILSLWKHNSWQLLQIYSFAEIAYRIPAVQSLRPFQGAKISRVMLCPFQQ